MERISDNANREILGRLSSTLSEILLENVQHGGMGNRESWRLIHDVIP